MEELPDAALVRRCLRLPNQGFALLYQRHSVAVYRYLLGLLGDAARAEDALQDSFFKAYRALARFDLERSFRCWLFAIARNTALDMLRSRRREPTTQAAHPAMLVSEAEPTLTSVTSRERKTLVREALDSLPAEARSVLLMKHFQGMTALAIAEVLGCSLRTAKYRLKAAARQLGTELARRAIDDREVV